MVSLGVMARLLHVQTKWLRSEAAAGRIPALKAGERFVFRRDVVAGIVADLAAGKQADSARLCVLEGGDR